ncbi:hypothetical protein [Peribacillus asahii]|uniref:hypothetical protein n=1 Tax=Peribacillus asahii TaxID=228899 RepID=UPI00207A6ED3|nr:hypothetical protein [Peribacillus asahii]USK83144.1 hypothetical protein LIT35_11535 [Peribacillus asahii]
MFKFRKVISIVLIITLICSMLPNYTGATAIDDQSKQTEKTLQNDQNLEEVVKERTANSKTFTDGKGNFLKEIYPEEIHNKVNGKYEAISEDLVNKSDNGYVETEATKLESLFPEKPSKNQLLKIW